MKNMGTCPKCGSTDIYTDKKQTKRGERCSIPVSSRVRFFIDTYVCISGGYAEEYADLLEEMHRKAVNPLMLSYYTSFFSRRIEWGVLGITRQYYTFHKNQITSKTDAGMWAIEIVPEKYHKILREALTIRNGKKSLYTSGIKRKRDAVVYMTYIYKDSENRFINEP